MIDGKPNPTEFKAGDKVKCINNKFAGKYEDGTPWFVVGNIYDVIGTVSVPKSVMTNLTFAEIGSSCSTRFEKV